MHSGKGASAPPTRILVVKLASLGDLLTATPALRALRTTHAQAHVAVLTTPASATVLGGLDSVDEVIPFDKVQFDRPADAPRGAPAAVALARRLRAGHWDALVLLHHLTTPFGVAKYAALCLASGAPVRAGLDNGRGPFLTHRARDRGFGWKHEADYWLDVVGTLGVESPASPRLEIAIAADDVAWAERLAPALGDAVLLQPGSGAFSVARRWAPERFVQVGRACRDELRLAPLVLAGLSPDEHTLARDIAGAIGQGAVVISAAPRPQALAALIRRCRVLVANDSGPVHLASAVGTPVVAIFGPTNHRAWGPYPADEPTHRVVREQVACQPCIHRGHEFGTPEGCAARTCLALVQPPQVLDAVARILSTSGLAAA